MPIATIRQRLFALAALLGLTACATADTTSEAPVMTAAEERKGKIAFLQCRSCHTVDEDGIHLTGPNLNGLLGAQAAGKSDYEYSDALRDADIVWNAETLDAWLTNPATYVPGNRMAFAGVASAEDRDLLIRYLTAVTQ
ncbi:MAG: c-type cytochrome [Pseudomonadota bacterium]